MTEREFDLNAHLLGLHKVERPPQVFGLDSPEKLKAWLLETGREYLVFAATDLVDALPWPAGVEAFQQIVQCYAQHRRAIPNGDAFKGEPLTAEELEQAIAALLREIRKVRPDWRPSW